MPGFVFMQGGILVLKFPGLCLADELLEERLEGQVMQWP